MPSLGPYILGAWLLAMALLLSGLVAAWVFRIPGTARGDFTAGARGKPAPRFFHMAGDTLKLVRPERRRFVYGLLLAGAAIPALILVGLFAASLLFQEPGQ
jgi:hypothetical protein